jgi:hypothetical protein
MPSTIDRTEVSAPVRAALDALARCVQLSSGCASSMIDLGGMRDAVRSALDCADLCAAAERVLARHGELDGEDAVTAAVDAAISACTASAAACGAHADHHAHCAAHARAATACVEALYALSGAA